MAVDAALFVFVCVPGGCVVFGHRPCSRLDALLGLRPQARLRAKVLLEMFHFAMAGEVLCLCVCLCAFVCRIDHIFDRQFRDASHVVVVSVCDRSKCECE